MAQINLPNLDPAIGTDELAKLYNPFVIWLSDIVDILNQDIDTIENLFNNFLITAQSVDIGGGGAGPIAVSVPGLTTSGVVNVTLLSSSNPVTITNVIISANQFTVTFSADPGASAIIKYVAYTAQP